MKSHDFSHVSRCSEHVRFTEARTEAKIISTAGVCGEYSLNRFTGKTFKENAIPEKGGSRWQQQVLSMMAVSWPGWLTSLSSRSHFMLCVAETFERKWILFPLLRPRWGPIKDPRLWCFNSWLFAGEKINPSSEPDGTSCTLGAARQCYRSPPVVLITVHAKGIHWSGRREESRGDPCCLRGGWRRNCTFPDVWMTIDVLIE